MAFWTPQYDSYHHLFNFKLHFPYFWRYAHLNENIFCLFAITNVLQMQHWLPANQITELGGAKLLMRHFIKDERGRRERHWCSEVRCCASRTGRIGIQERRSAEEQEGGNQGSGSARRAQICMSITRTLTHRANNGEGKHNYWVKIIAYLSFISTVNSPWMHTHTHSDHLFPARIYP